MTELSPYRNVHPPHLNHYLRSTHGEFRLIELPGGRTRLEGRTWYQFDMFPSWYWTLWSDLLIHKIHERVLMHIKGLAERQPLAVQYPAAERDILFRRCYDRRFVRAAFPRCPISCLPFGDSPCRDFIELFSDRLRSFFSPAPFAIGQPAHADAKPLRALLVLGGCCHDYAKQKDILAKGIAERANVVVDIAYDSNKGTKP